MGHRRATAAVTAAVAMAALAAVPAGAQSADGMMSASPTSGPAGSVISVSGTGCARGAVEVGLRDPQGTGVTDASTHGDDLGDWSANLQVPTDADPGDVFVIEGECIMEGAPVYAPIEFVVTVLPMTVDPTSGPVGTTIEVAGSGGCAGDALEIYLLEGTSIDDSSAIVDWSPITPAEDGTWSGQLVVYDTMLSSYRDPNGDYLEVDVVPGGDYFVMAQCVYRLYTIPGTDLVISDFAYSDFVDFEVTRGGTAPPRIDTPGPPSWAPGVSLEPQAPPATPVIADPGYTG